MHQCLGTIVREAREDRWLTREQLATKARCDVTTIARMERSRSSAARVCPFPEAQGRVYVALGLLIQGEDGVWRATIEPADSVGTYRPVAPASLDAAAKCAATATEEISAAERAGDERAARYRHPGYAAQSTRDGHEEYTEEEAAEVKRRMAS